MKRQSLLGYGMVAAAVLTVGVLAWARAGDVNPPAGPVQGTMHTLDEIYDRVSLGQTVGAAGRWKSIWIPGMSSGVTVVANAPGVIHAAILDGDCVTCGRVMLYDADTTSIADLPRIAELTHITHGDSGHSSLYIPLDAEFSHGLVLEQSNTAHGVTLLYRLD
ncbi:MAG TPA: hypothetical protein VG797_03975 [Phycisphaerales bacterium]|nr:hypothetical protein [Phycisphaerales bacterium]